MSMLSSHVRIKPEGDPSASNSKNIMITRLANLAGAVNRIIVIGYRIYQACGKNLEIPWTDLNPKCTEAWCERHVDLMTIFCVRARQNLLVQIWENDIPCGNTADFRVPPKSLQQDCAIKSRNCINFFAIHTEFKCFFQFVF